MLRVVTKNECLESTSFNFNRFSTTTTTTLLRATTSKQKLQHKMMKFITYHNILIWVIVIAFGAVLGCEAFLTIKSIVMTNKSSSSTTTTTTTTIIARERRVTKTTTTSLHVVINLNELPGSTPPFKSFDPLQLSNFGSDATFAWFQAAELKHSRCAMLAIVGYLVQKAGIHFPGILSHSDDVSFDSLSTLSSPFEQWQAVPDAGKYQILFTIFITEIATEVKKPHYTMVEPLPTMIVPPFNFINKVDKATLIIKRSRELNNGRLAMIAITAYFSEYCIPGSVPVLQLVQ